MNSFIWESVFYYEIIFKVAIAGKCPFLTKKNYEYEGKFGFKNYICNLIKTKNGTQTQQANLLF